MQTKPYATGSDAYAGDAGAINREIGPSTTVQVNQSAGGILGSGTAASDGKLLDVLRTISAHLQSTAPADQAALGTTDLQRLDAVADQLGQMRAQTGAVANRLSLAQTRLAQSQDTATSALAQVEDADMAQTLVDYSTQQTAYQAALKAGAYLIQPSLPGLPEHHLTEEERPCPSPSTARASATSRWRPSNGSRCPTG